MSNIYLEHNYHYNWHHQGNLSFKGFLFDEYGNLLDKHQAQKKFETLDSIEELEKELKKIDGSFSFIRRTNQGILIFNDFMSTFPVFYTWQNEQWFVSDNSYRLLELLEEKRCNHSAFAEFSGAGFVLGKETLLSGILKTQAAEIVLLKPDGSHTTKIYSRWLPKGFLQKNRDELNEMLYYLLDKASDSFIESLQGRHVVVSLSGGFDSRLIACMLKNKGYENVTCLTYGRPSQESHLAQKVAIKLGYKWIFVNYNEVEIDGYLNNEIFRNYYRYAGNNHSMPYLQDYFAVKHLKDNNLIPSDSIFVPGHSGDFLGGSYVNRTARTNVNSEMLPEYIHEKYFKFGSYNAKGSNQVIARLKKWFDENTEEGFTHNREINFWVEEWDVKEKLSKFIFQSVQVFPYFGYGFRLPLWSKPLRDFFREVPIEFRENKNLYDEVLTEKYFKPNGVYFESDEIKSGQGPIKLDKVKTFLKTITPQVILDKRIIANDVICYQRLTLPMKKQISGKIKFGTNKTFCFNNIVCKWYIQTVCASLHEDCGFGK